MKRIGVAMALTAATIGGGGPAFGQQQDDNLTRGMITPQTQEAIDSGLAYLARTQNGDGSFGTHGFSGNVAFTSIAGLAFLSGGHQPGRGRYGANVRKAVEFILTCEDPGQKGYLHNTGRGGMHGPLYAHGFAVLFLAEVHGMVSEPLLRDRVRATLGRAVELTVRSQNKAGGWRYRPGDGDADISATICQIMALRAARNAGLTVPKETADRCIEYVKRCQDPASGGFRYQPSGGPPLFPRSAAGIVALYSSGVYEGKELEQGLNYLMRFRPGGGGGGGGFLGQIEAQAHYHYGHYYAAQAMWIAGGRYWREWFPAIRDELVGTRQADGSWQGQFCPHYCTGMSLIILQIPNRYLPILQR